MNKHKNIRTRISLKNLCITVGSMRAETKIRVDVLTKHNRQARLILDSPKSGQSSNGNTLSISGWAYAPGDAPVRIAVRRKGSTFLTTRSILRSDVYNHLKKLGEKAALDSVYGFRFDFLGDEEVFVGFEMEGSLYWSHRVREVPLIKFIEFKTLSELLLASEGTCRNVYFHNAEDWSKAIIFFNGALTSHKMEEERTVFQRWSWAKQFKHPVISIADPLTIGEAPLVLAWYLGAKGRNALPEILSPIISEIRKKNPNVRIIGLGSSGGGFAAIGGALLGYLDEAIAMNPQTDAMEFEVKSAVLAFNEARNYAPCDSDLKSYYFSQLKRGALVTYLQNLQDKHHAEEHYKPFRAVSEISGYADRFRFIDYEDAVAGHAPPNMVEMKALIGQHFNDLLK